MNVRETIQDFQVSKSIPDEFVESIDTDDALRAELVFYFMSQQDRRFAIALLDKMISFRKQEGKGMSGESIMLSSYLLGLHNNVEDCLRIWNAKTTDFDTHCGVDIQLVVFIGFEETINFLETIESKDAKDCLEYLVKCKTSGDFDKLDEYYRKDKLPWYF